MEFVCYADRHQIPESVNTLFNEAAKESIFYSRPWFDNLIDHGLEDGQTLLLAAVVESETVLALLPLTYQESGYCKSFGHIYSSLFTLLLSNSNRSNALSCLAEGLKQLPVFSLRLDPIAETDTDLELLEQALILAGFRCHRYFRFFNWYQPTSDLCFDAYMSERPSRVRNTVARKSRKLEREHGYHIRLYTDSEIDQGLSDYTSVYNASWKAHEQYDDFIEGLAHTLSAAGWLRLAVLYIADQPVAAQFWFVAHGKASIFKLAYDQAWKHYSPGSILIAYLMKHVIDIDKVDEIDFLTGNDNYKQDWMAERRQRWRLHFTNSNSSQQSNLTFTQRLKSLKAKLYNRFFLRTR